MYNFITGKDNNMKDKFKRIKIIIYFCYANILFSVFIGLAISNVVYQIFSDFFNIILAIISFLIITFLLFYLINRLGVFLINKENYKHKDYLCLYTKHVGKTLNELCLEKVNEHIYVYVYGKRMFNTISFYFFDNTTDIDIKKSKNICDKYIKNKYPKSKCKEVTKSHWVIKGQIFISSIVKFDFFKSCLNKNSNQLYEIGLISCFLDIEKSQIIIPFYKNQRINIVAFNRYYSFLKKINSILKICSIDEINM